MRFVERGSELCLQSKILLYVDIEFRSSGAEPDICTLLKRKESQFKGGAPTQRICMSECAACALPDSVGSLYDEYH